MIIALKRVVCALVLVLCPVLAGVASVLNDHLQQRRRIGTEAKAKVVACIWEAEFVPFLAVLAVLPWSI